MAEAGHRPSGQQAAPEPWRRPPRWRHRRPVESAQPVLVATPAWTSPAMMAAELDRRPIAEYARLAISPARRPFRSQNQARNGVDRAHHRTGPGRRLVRGPAADLDDPERQDRDERLRFVLGIPAAEPGLRAWRPSRRARRCGGARSGPTTAATSLPASQYSHSSDARGSASRFRLRWRLVEAFGLTRSTGIATRSPSITKAAGTVSTPRVGWSVARTPWSAPAARRRASSAESLTRRATVRASARRA